VKQEMRERIILLKSLLSFHKLIEILDVKKETIFLKCVEILEKMRT